MKVYESDPMCGICQEYVDYEDFSLDHIIALARGGTHTYENVQTSHLICNIRKGARDGRSVLQ